MRKSFTPSDYELSMSTTLQPFKNISQLAWYKLGNQQLPLWGQSQQKEVAQGNVSASARNQGYW